MAKLSVTGLKEFFNAAIRTKTLPRSVTRDNVATAMDNIVDSFVHKDDAGAGASDAEIDGNTVTSGLFGQDAFDALLHLGSFVSEEAGSTADIDRVLQQRNLHNAGVPFIIVITQNFTHQFQNVPYVLNRGELVLLGAYRNAPSGIIEIPKRTGDYFGKIEVSPSNIAAPADLDGDYQIALSNMPEALLKALGVNEIEIWFKDFAIHTVANWIPVENTVVSVNINETEERSVGLTNEDHIRVLAVFRRRVAGNSAYVTETGTIFTIGGAGGGTSEDASARASAKANSDRLDRISPFSDIQVEPPGIPDRNFPSRLTFQFGDKQTDKTIRQVRVIDAFGNTVHTEAGDVFSGDVVVAELSNNEVVAISNNLASDDKISDLNLYIDFTDGSTSFRRRWRYPVNNEDFAAESLTRANKERLDKLEPQVKSLEAQPVVQVIASSAVLAFNVGNGEIADVTLSHNTTLTVTGGRNGDTALLRVKQDGTGNRTLTLGAGLEFVSAPSLSTAAGKTDLLMFNRIGATWKFVGIVQEA